jgi:hypothetical protein
MAHLNTGLDLLYIQDIGPGFSSCNFVAQILVAIFVLLKKRLSCSVFTVDMPLFTVWIVIEK